VPTSDLPIQDIATFVAVAESASFTRAAEKLGTSKSNVGKAVQRLEGRLGTRRLQRTTRAVRLTEDGELYLDAARVALDGLNEAEVALSARRDEPVGRVRLDVPVGFGRLLLPTFERVRQRYPKVAIELSLSDRQSDPVKDGWDIVVRAGVLPAEGEMTVRRLCEIRLGLYASSDYLAAHAPLTSIEELTGHQAVIFRAGSGKTRPWTVADGNRVLETAPSASVIIGDGRALVD
jgi:DNA-binding transcriptional LysR family regulator